MTGAMTLKSYDDIRVGDRASVSCVVTDDMVRDFAALSGDRNPLHLDDEFASRMRWKRRRARVAAESAGGIRTGSSTRGPTICS